MCYAIVMDAYQWLLVRLRKFDKEVMNDWKWNNYKIMKEGINFDVPSLKKE